LLCSLLLDVEVLDLISGLVEGDHVQKLLQTVTLQVLLSQILQVSLRKSNIHLHVHLLVVVSHLHRLPQVTSLAVDLNSLPQVFGEVGCVEDFILDRLGAVDSEGADHLSLSLLLDFLLDLSSLLGDGLRLSLFCGHHKYIF
jgi:hypothetical protein